MPNRLANETSPYLLQHQHNPVDWHPWSEEALQKARQEHKPIFLSIGYSACHWCHVMEKESFENEDTAVLMNKHFVNIKVDREERPDLDTIYMQAVVAMTGHGGWPMSIWMTADGVPFYGGTYFPPERRYGMPSFVDVIQNIADAWINSHEKLLQGGLDLLEHISRRQFATEPSSSSDMQIATLDEATQKIWKQFDWNNAGWGGAPKFPQPMVIEFLLRQHHRTGDPLALEMAEKTLSRMADGGIYDQLGGGFHRYSVDDVWLVPHFEKMLYDNSQLARVYLHLYQINHKPNYRRIVEEICDYVLREMTDAAGGFFSAQDADSEGEEGRFFTWNPEEVGDVLGDEASLFMHAYDITPSGNFEGKSIPRLMTSMAELAQNFKISKEEATLRIAESKRKLWEVREQREKPGLDDKVLTSWNGLMLASLAEASRVLGRADYLEAAVHNAMFLLSTMRSSNGRLLHTWRRGSAPKLNGYLEDYAYLADALLELYQATLDEHWFLAAQDLVDLLISHFTDEAGESFYDVSDDHESLVVRPKDLQDNATPSGSGMAATVLFKLAAYTGNRQYYNRACAAVLPMQMAMREHPTAFGQWLQALSFALGNPSEIAIVGDPQSTDTQALLAETHNAYLPHQVVAVAPSDKETSIALLDGRPQVDGRATAHVCQSFVCHLPITDPETLRARLMRTDHP